MKKGKPFKMRGYIFSKNGDGIDYLREGDIAIVRRTVGRINAITFHREPEEGADTIAIPVKPAAGAEISFERPEFVTVQRTMRFFGIEFKFLEPKGDPDAVTRIKLTHLE